ncbi:SecY-interacting protein [Alteromonas sp. 5E99-2]|uniref:SecY-interacting protein n=1 Tax=Alteromonas sp. 5E99-2 TaxID=2817683 RepID=UPI001A99A373|nr:SecY-interacting protein [Alteromonas sp. 5E99-2]MBO1254118.1 SecY-interacting protein [Alteromonas sp. 5E99-2]
MNVHQSLTEFVEKFISLSSKSKRTIEYDPEWPSICVDNTNIQKGENVIWTPKVQEPKQSFSNVEEGLEIRLHSDIKAFYTAFWSESLFVRSNGENYELLQVWNEEDFAILQENLIGHVLMKRRLKQAETLFIGLADEDDIIVSVNNEFGQVVLEQVGREPHKVLANSLPEFISGLVVD